MFKKTLLAPVMFTCAASMYVLAKYLADDPVTINEFWTDFVDDVKDLYDRQLV
jgi:hypothetical protein